MIGFEAWHGMRWLQALAASALTLKLGLDVFRD
jgi:hypothetical protein